MVLFTVLFFLMIINIISVLQNYSLIILMLYLCTIKLLIKVQDCSGENCSDVRPNKSQTQPSI